MVNEIDPSEDRGTPLPFLSSTVKETVGALPAMPPVTVVMFTASPFNKDDAVGATCAPAMEASKSISPCGIWQVLHSLSSNCGPPGWLTPTRSLTWPWHAPQAARVGLVR